jgi:hypothetical protein
LANEIIQLKLKPTLKLGLVIRVLYLPLGLKEYLINLLGFPLLPNLISSLIVYFLNALLFCCIGINLTSIEQVLKDADYADLPLAEKLSIILLGIILISSIVFFIYIHKALVEKMSLNKNSFPTRKRVKSLPNLNFH